MSGIIAQNTLDGSGLIKSPEGGGVWNFIKKITASGDSDIAFVDGADDVVLDSTYKEYVFIINNFNPDTSAAYDLRVNFSIDGGSNYNVTKTTTAARAYHFEDDSNSTLQYSTGEDLAQSTGNQTITGNVGYSSGDESGCAILHLFDPSNTTFVKHFISTANRGSGDPVSGQVFIGGYANTTSAIDAIQFNAAAAFSAAINMYGIST
jgi:hypothetical protein